MNAGPWQHIGPFRRLFNVGRAIGTRWCRAGAVLTALACTAFVSHATVLDPPVLRCASVNVANDVTLTWTAPPDPGGDFAYYEIFHATNPAGPFASIGTVAVYGQATFLHPATGAGIGPQFYYMTTVSTAAPPNTSAPSDTVATLYLEVFQSVPLGSANLVWNAPATAPTAGSLFQVWMEYPIGNWVLLDEVPTTTFAYQHVVSVCEDSLTFRIGLTDAVGCISFSNRAGDVFEDLTPPSSPAIITVTVDSVSGLSNLSWIASPEGDTDGYIIVLSIPGGGVIIDTVWGQNNTTYEWLASTPGDAAESFTLAAFDTCQVGDPPGPNTSATRPPHTTIHAVTDYDRCGAEVTVSWTPYVGVLTWSYQILYQADGGLWSLLTNAPAEATSVTHQVTPGRTYCYIVKAIMNGGLTSLSNKTCRTAAYPTVPAFNYLRTVTVSGEQQITVIDSVDVDAQVSYYRLERSDNGGPYAAVATAPGGLGPLITFVDDDVTPGETGYRYRVVVADSCGTEVLTSNVGGNIVLRAVPELSGDNVLTWNGYEVWAGAPVAYRIYRQVDDQPFTLTATQPDQPWAYVDPVQAFTGGTGRFCYYVQAVEGGNPSGYDATSESNVSCAVQEELVYIPNAFIVGGINNIFLPVLSYADVKSYELSIINRWGQVIWTSTDRDEGWDGQVNGTPAPIGIYAYYCAFSTGAGKRVEKRGTVTLLTAMDR